MSRVALESANVLKVSLMAAAMLAICLLALVETTNTAQAEDSLPENGKIAFSREQLEHEIYAVNPDDSGLRQLTHRADTNDIDIQPAWSPDGTKIAFGSQDSIWVMDAYGSNLRRLTPNKSDVSYYDPSWSPDGTELAFTGFSEPDVYQTDIYTMDVDGSNITNITKSSRVAEDGVDFSPDGSQMCFERARGTSAQKLGIYVMNVDGSNLTRLTHQYGMDCAWSPEGTKIAYKYERLLTSESAITDVYVMNADGSGKTNLTKGPKEGGGSPSWSPDGKRIAFSDTRDTGIGDFGETFSDIYTMDAYGSDVVRVTKTSLDVSEMQPDWQPLTPESRSMTVDPPDTGGPSLLLVASALLLSGSVMFCAGLKRRM